MSDFTLGDTRFFGFTSSVNGLPTTLAGTPVVSAYEDASLIQITAGVSISADHDGVTGFNMITVAATAANGFEANKQYHLVVTTGTINGVSVAGTVVGAFSLGASAAAADLANGTDGLGAIKTDTAAILVETGTTIPGTITTLQADTDDIQARLPAALVFGRMDSDMGAISTSTAAADALELSTEAIVAGAAAAGTHSTTEMTTDLTVSVAGQYNGRIIIFQSDTTTAALRNQATDINATTVLNGKLGFTALTTEPVNGDKFIIV